MCHHVFMYDRTDKNINLQKKNLSLLTYYLYKNYYPRYVSPYIHVWWNRSEYQFTNKW